VAGSPQRPGKVLGIRRNDERRWV